MVLKTFSSILVILEQQWLEDLYSVAKKKKKQPTNFLQFSKFVFLTALILAYVNTQSKNHYGIIPEIINAVSTHFSLSVLICCFMR